jgi:hypothetical protein
MRGHVPHSAGASLGWKIIHGFGEGEFVMWQIIFQAIIHGRRRFSIL